MQPVRVHKTKTEVVPVSLGFNVSNDTFTSDIRETVDPESALIASWTVEFDTDGRDGELLLIMDDTITSAIVHTSGYMDLKKTNGIPVDLFPEPLEVIFIEP